MDVTLPNTKFNNEYTEKKHTEKKYTEKYTEKFDNVMYKLMIGTHKESSKFSDSFDSSEFTSENILPKIMEARKNGWSEIEQLEREDKINESVFPFSQEIIKAIVSPFDIAHNLENNLEGIKYNLNFKEIFSEKFKEDPLNVLLSSKFFKELVKDDNQEKSEDILCDSTSIIKYTMDGLSESLHNLYYLNEYLKKKDNSSKLTLKNILANNIVKEPFLFSIYRYSLQPNLKKNNFYEETEKKLLLLTNYLSDLSEQNANINKYFHPNNLRIQIIANLIFSRKVVEKIIEKIKIEPLTTEQKKQISKIALFFKQKHLIEVVEEKQKIEQKESIEKIDKLFKEQMKKIFNEWKKTVKEQKEQEIINKNKEDILTENSIIDEKENDKLLNKTLEEIKEQQKKQELNGNNSESKSLFIKEDSVSISLREEIKKQNKQNSNNRKTERHNKQLKEDSNSCCSIF